jgi:hypothetical protein
VSPVRTLAKRVPMLRCLCCSVAFEVGDGRNLASQGRWDQRLFTDLSSSAPSSGTGDRPRAGAGPRAWEAVLSDAPFSLAVQRVDPATGQPSATLFNSSGLRLVFKVRVTARPLIVITDCVMSAWRSRIVSARGDAFSHHIVPTSGGFLSAKPCRTSTSRCPHGWTPAPTCTALASGPPRQHTLRYGGGACRPSTPGLGSKLCSMDRLLMELFHALVPCCSATATLIPPGRGTRTRRSVPSLQHGACMQRPCMQTPDAGHQLVEPTVVEVLQAALPCRCPCATPTHPGRTSWWWRKVSEGGRRVAGT